MAELTFAQLASKWKDCTPDFQFNATLVLEYWEDTLRFLMDAERIPNVLINHLAINTWRMCEYDFIKTAVHNIRADLGTVQFMWNPRKNQKPVIMLPDRWPLKFMEDPTIATGSVTFAGSLAYEYWSGHDFRKSGHKERATGIEAELYLTLQATGVEWQLNDWQQAVLRDMPQGWASVPEQFRFDDYRPVARAGWERPGPSKREIGQALGIPVLPIEE